MAAYRFRRERRSRRSRLWRLLRWLLAIAAMIAITALLQYRDMIELRDRARTIDGDSLEIGDERIRLRGIDAPELDQHCRHGGRDYPCGREARRHLARLIGAGKVLCRGAERDRFARLLATCRVDGIDLNRRMVRDGWALAYGDYDAEEAAARAARRGLWRGSFQSPRQGRDRRKDALGGR